MLEGVGVDRSQTATQHVPIVYSGTSINPCVDDTDVLTLVISNNISPAAAVQIDVYYALGA